MLMYISKIYYMEGMALDTDMSLLKTDKSVIKNNVFVWEINQVRQDVSVFIDEAKTNTSLDIQSQMCLCFLYSPKMASTGS